MPMSGNLFDRKTIALVQGNLQSLPDTQNEDEERHIILYAPPQGQHLRGVSVLLHDTMPPIFV